MLGSVGFGDFTQGSGKKGSNKGLILDTLSKRLIIIKSSTEFKELMN